MKKELLIASALVSTLGAASVANAVTATMSGAHMTGLKGNDTDAGTDDTIAARHSSLTSQFHFQKQLMVVLVLLQALCLQTKVITGLQTAGLTLTFTDGSKLDVINAGNAAASHDVSVPGGAGEAGVTVTSTNNAQTGLDFFGEATAIGVEWHSAADFMADGLKIGASFSADTWCCCYNISCS